jgi:AcrR family transcriptional regulator
MPAAEPLRRPGRPRLFEAESAVLSATVDALSEDGYAGFTIDRVAARAGIARATIYRRWPAKGDLLVALLRSLHARFELPDTGSLEGDLRALLERYPNASASTSERVLAALASETFNDAALAETLRTEFIAPRGRAMAVLFTRAIERREIRADADVTMLVNVTWGFFWQRRFIAGLGVDRAAIAAFVHALLDGVRAA